MPFCSKNKNIKSVKFIDRKMQYAPLSDDSVTADSPSSSEIEKGSGEYDSRVNIPGSKVIKSLKNSQKTNKHLSEPLTSPSSLDDDLILYENGDDMEKNEGSSGPSSKADDDPFYVFKQDLERKLELVEEALSRYLRVVHDTVSSLSTTTNPPLLLHQPATFFPGHRRKLTRRKRKEKTTQTPHQKRGIDPQRSPNHRPPRRIQTRQIPPPHFGPRTPKSQGVRSIRLGKNNRLQERDEFGLGQGQNAAG